jgi:flagellar assembly protein FliH
LSDAPSFAPILDGRGANASVWSVPSFDGVGSRSTLRTAKQLEDIEAEAHREGHARGYTEGLAKGRMAAQAEVARLRDVLAHLQQPVAELDRETESALVALMLELARRLVQQELAADPSKLVAIVRDAVGHLSQPVRGLRVRLHPDDAHVVSAHLPPQEPGEEWRVIADPSLMPGDCVVETENGRVDARLDTRQAQLAQRLLGESNS